VSDYETIQRRRNIIVGVFVVAGMCALGWLVFKFRDFPSIVSRIGSYDLFVQFPTSPGVEADTPVRFCGYQIGSVTAVRPPKVMKDLNTGAFYHQTLVVLSIDNEYNDIPANVEVKLMTRGLGSSYIELKLSRYDVNEPTGPVLAKGSKLQGATGVTSEFFPEETQKKVEELVKDLDTFIDNANHILSNPKNKADLDKTIANLADVSGYASDRLRDAGGTLRDVNETLDVIYKTIIEDVRPAIADFRKFMDTGSDVLTHVDANSERLVVALVDASGELGKTLSELRLILEKVNNGEGSAGRFVNDGKFYETLLENTEQVELLLKDLRAFVAEFRKKLPVKITVF